MKELFAQSLSNELADSDRVASAVPGQVGAKNILFSKFWAQLKALFGVNNWSAREYKSSPCIIVYNKQQYILDESVAPLPYTSTDFATELANGIWLPLGGGSGASIASNVSVTPPTGYTSTDMQGLSNEFALRIWREDLTAWVGTGTTLTLISNVFRDFGTVGVSTAVTVTLTAVTSPQLAHYAFKFKYSTGGSFIFTGVHLASGNPTLTNGKYYEASIIRGELIYKEVA